MSHWACAPLDRMQVTLFAPTLDDSLAADHPVRLFDDILRSLDFSAWESMYVRVVGQPPIHPRTMAAGLLYGMSLGIRSSRRLEDACCNRLDVIWLMEGRKPDHATICKFRTAFAPQLKELFRQVGRVGIEMGLVTLNQVMLDGTSIRANNSRHKTGRRPKLQEKLAALNEQIERMMAQFQRQDQTDNQLYGESSPAKLPRSLKDMQRRQKKLQEAMAKLAEMECERAGRKDLSAKGPAVPLTDVDCRVLPNKEGGYAPNYTAVLAVDGDSGMLVGSQVLGDNDEAGSVMVAVEEIQEDFGRKPDQLVADSGFNTGRNLSGLCRAGVEPLMPAKQPQKENPAERPDLSQPVATQRHDDLPVNAQNKVLDKSAFIYDAQGDRYICPTGRALEYRENKPYAHGRNKGVYRVYECASCAGCPLAGRCLIKNTERRRVCRDEYEGLRQEMAGRMKSDQGKAEYKRRSHVAEAPFAILKAVMGVRRFLLRGIEKVQMETTWLTTAYNLRKLMRVWSVVRVT